MNERNAYDVLGVAPGANQVEIKAAYRARSLLFHPDRLAGMPEAARAVALDEMKALNTAYGVLKDPLKRAALDRKLEALAAQATSARPAVSPDTVPSSAQGPEPHWEQTRPTTPPQGRVRVTAGGAADRRQVPWPAIFPPLSPTPTPPAVSRAMPARPRSVRRADLRRFSLFSAMTSLGWVGVLLTEIALPSLCTGGVVLGFGMVLVGVMPLIKPAPMRRPRSAGGLAWRGLLLALVMAMLIGVVVLPRVMLALVGGGSGASKALPLLVGVIFVLFVHWGICLAGYLLT